MAYAGHQFGHFVPRLGDGRAHLLGEVIDIAGQRRDIQLKGSGPTSFSRGGDGRCALGPAIREFIMSEAMHALGVPTTRCLAVVTSGESVKRELPLPGAIVTRVAASHLRVGTFQFFAARGDRKALRRLCDYAIERHYPELAEVGDTADRCIALLDKVIEKQITLVVNWMRVAFIHGVMNTDNTAISGETIDYGPCAMMSVYDPQTTFSSIDRFKRYAFGNQPAIIEWNMARFAQCLLPIIDDDESVAREKVGPSLNSLPTRLEKAFLDAMGAKVGLTPLQPGDEAIVRSLLELMAKERLDYTTTFHRLGLSLASEATTAELSTELRGWTKGWRKRLEQRAATREETRKIMGRNNPAVIPRNHHVEAVLQKCLETGESESAERFLSVLRSPYEELPDTSLFQDPPHDGDKNYRTFCGT